MGNIRFFAPVLLLVAATFAACGDDETPPSNGTSPSDEAGADANGTIDAGPQRAEFGLDSRPTNTTCKAPPRPPSNATIKLEKVYENLGFPMVMAQRPGDASRWYVARRGGQLSYFPTGTPPTSTNDMSDAMTIPSIAGSPGFDALGEGGFLGFVFHPQFAQNGKAYISFTAPPIANNGPSMSSVVAEITSTDGGNTFTGYRTMLRFDQTDAGNHKGGGLAIDKNGLLYASFGDGGGANDAYFKGQTKDGFFSKVLRIDPSKKDPGKEYAIPADNPFATGAGGHEPAVFAYGFRNPFRISLDRETGDLWVGDVGQNSWEEVDLVKSGGNYGWPCFEGTHEVYTTLPHCPSTVGLKPPIVEHAHAIDFPNQYNTRSISGGVVYRGKAIPSLVGSYIYGDYKRKDFFVLTKDVNTGEWKSTADPDASALGGSWVGFAEDIDGEVYAISLNDWIVYKVVPAAPQTGTPFPDRLSKTGCKDTAGLVPYGVNAQLWSDGASKSRFIAMPDDQKITVKPDGDFDLPNGTVLVKSFALGGKPIETRLLVHHDDGGWAGYTYEWLDDGSDAVLLAGAKSKVIGTQSWLYPGRADCANCHTAAAGKTLGLELGQLNGELLYPSTNRIANQLKTLEHIGMFAAPLGKPVDQIVAYPVPESTNGTLDERARAYLHANCSHCHRPTGPGGGDTDMRFATPLAMAGICNVAPTDELGVAGSKLLVPGDPAKSLISLRPHAQGANRMPPLASSVVDDQGLKVVDDWIKSIAACP